MGRPRRTPEKPPIALAAWREAAGLTQEAAAAMLGVHPVTVAKWETGDIGLTMARLIELSVLYNAPDVPSLWHPPGFGLSFEAREVAAIIERADPDKRARVLDAVRLMFPEHDAPKLVAAPVKPVRSQGPRRRPYTLHES